MSENGVKNSKIFESTYVMMIASVLPSMSSRRLWTQHEWRNWLWQIDTSHLEIMGCTGVVRRKYALAVKWREHTSPYSTATES